MVLKRIKGHYLVLNPDAPNLMVVDEKGKELIMLFDGRRTVSEVLDRLSSTYGSGKKETQRLQAFTGSLIDAAYLHTEPPAKMEKIGLGPRKLTRLFLHLTNECNLRCSHCFRSAGSKMQNEMPENSLVRVVKEFADLGGTSLILTGGEPLLRREDLRTIARKAKDCGIRDITIATNGTLVSDNDVKLFKKHDITVAVSLDGGTMMTHDQIRGEGMFHLTVRNIVSLVKAGVKTYVETTLMRPNLNEVNQIMRLVKQLGVSLAAFSTVMPKGRAEANRMLLTLGNDDILSVYTAIKTGSKLIGIETNVEGYPLKSRLRHRRVMCGAGIHMLSIGANGDVYPCQSLHDESLKAGNIQEQSLTRIWNESPILREFREMTVLDFKKCKSCELKFICAGGCRADAYNAYRDLHACSPLCSVNRKIYWNRLIEMAQEMWEKA